MGDAPEDEDSDKDKELVDLGERVDALHKSRTNVVYFKTCRTPPKPIARHAFQEDPVGVFEARAAESREDRM